ncbi:hypothetical protein GJAV_G00274770 [Gymnothorax javanicus]|nr:hypothetical protein GJAV_G00274770 [Gymnothorax javanicus]
MWLYLVAELMLLAHSGLSEACGSGQYNINGWCCQMCPVGKYVDRDCTEESRTLCKPCGPNKYNDRLSSDRICSSCQSCDTGRGLKTYSNCTDTNNTVCEPLDQHYCSEHDERSCRRAQKHTICQPGQYIQRNGAISTDTKCGACPAKTFSNTPSAMHCKSHTDCQSAGLEETAAGTNTSDTKCRSRVPSPDSLALILSLALFVVAVAAVAFGAAARVGVEVCFISCRNCHSGCPCAQTSGALPSTVAQQNSGALPTDIALQNMSSVQIMNGETKQANEETTVMMGLLQKEVTQHIFMEPRELLKPV